MRRPLYQQVEDALKAQILSGRRPVGYKLPTESALSDMFNVSRDTIRRAIRSLKDEGLVKATPGVGTVVVRNRPEMHKPTLKRLTEHLRDAGLPLDIELVDVDLREPSRAIREHLRLPAGERVLRIQRTRKIAARPFSMTTFYVPEWVGIGTEADFTSSIHTLIEKDRKNFIIYGTDRISARAPTAEEQQVLTIPDNLPLLIVRRTSYTDHDRPIEYFEAAIRSDLYEYIITLPREI